MGDEEKNQKKTYNKGMMRQAFPIIFFILMLVYSLSLLIPMLWTLLSSVKGRLDFYNNPFGLPKCLEIFQLQHGFQQALCPDPDGNGQPQRVYAGNVVEYTSLYVGRHDSDHYVALLRRVCVREVQFPFRKIPVRICHRGADHAHRRIVAFRIAVDPRDRFL